MAMATGLRSGTLEALRDVLSVACVAVGVDELNIRIRGETVVIEQEGVSIALQDAAGRAKWCIQETYQVSDPNSGWNEKTEEGQRFDVGDESQCARAAALLVAHHRIDSALDRHM
ncbi:hypothetical protein ACVIGB_000631 [Bradyrhizobium sp. USDA 4341]